MTYSSILTITNAIIMFFSVIYAYMAIYVFLGLFKTKKYPKARHFHKIGILIAARNEENVIGELIDSINGQDYPKEFYQIFVVADNCTDNTAETARKHGAVCYERFDDQHCTKGFALQFLFNNIYNDFSRDCFECFLILDADNILNSDYLSKMNDAYDNGEKIITSYRCTKNFDSNIIAASYAFHWLRTCRCENRAKSLLHTACRIQGTGFMFDKALVYDGWKYTGLTEDRAFCADAVAKGYRISYQDEAIFYDEQPENLHIAIRQRTRWAKGHLESFFEFAPSILHRLFTSKSVHEAFTCYDMLTITIPSSLITLLINIFQVCTCFIFIYFGNITADLLWSLLLSFIINFANASIFNVITAAYIFTMERDRLPHLSIGRIIMYILAFPMFDIIGTITYLLAAFTKVTWKPIPHHSSSERLSPSSGRFTSSAV